MNKNYKALEFDKVLLMLSNETSCEDSKKLALKLEPKFSLEEVDFELKQTSDAHMLCVRFGNPSFGGLHNIDYSLKRASSGGLLTMGDLLKVAMNLKVFRGIKEWQRRYEDVSSSLDNLFNSVLSNKTLEEKICNSIISEDEMADKASSELANIRRKIKSSSLKIRDQLDKMIKSSRYQKYLQDSIVTIRDSRFVVPVKAECRSEIPGLVHDASSSGSTLFIEPMSVVEANNDIRLLKSKEDAEIERILFELSSEVGDFADTIISSYDMCVNLNFIFAKANLAYKMKATLPKVNIEGIVELKKARHPLINLKNVVPIDIELGKNFDTLVITGPNTGGKTVSLKTIGLLTVMAMSGLMIPTSENSEISIFKNILVDIGDEQSIEQSLSTFSSHMINISQIMKNADRESLILLDELGAGTDPVEGAALATSVLEFLKTKESKIVATTHYAEIKSYAITTDRVENACCEFDVSTLKPTYRLLVGVPGRSNAFAISERLGIDSDVILRAKELITEESTKFEDVIKSLDETRQKLEREKEKVEVLKKESLILKREIEEERENFHKEKNLILKNAKSKAQTLVSQTKSQANGIIDELLKIKKSKREITDEEKIRLKSSLRKMEESSDPILSKKNDSYVLPRKLKPGDSVLIFDIDKKAEVLEKEDSSGNILVQAGIIKTRVSVKNLRLLKEENNKKVVGNITRNVKSKMNTKIVREIDLRGKTALEAIIDLDAFIDSSVLSGVHQLTIIHGKGTGVLRKEINSHLKKHPSVKSHRLGVFGEGESGVTIVELK